MEEKKETPTEINSFYVIHKFQSNHFDLNKKRKLPAEQLGLPLPKHKHCSESFPSEFVFPYGSQPETGRMNIHLMKGNTDGVCFDEESEPESAKDSNSFNVESDSATFVFGEAKLESNWALTCSSDSSSTQSFSCGGASSTSTQYYLESSTAMGSNSTEQEVEFVSRETALPHHNDSLHAIDNLEEHLLQLGNYEAYSCAEYGNDSSIEQCTDQELEDLLYSNGLNPNKYVLSSGRWTVNQESQSGTKNPTIDQEFEQYFSMLML